MAVSVYLPLPVFRASKLPAATDTVGVRARSSATLPMAARLDAMYEVVTKYLPRLANRQIVLDSGTLVGELSDGMNRTLGRNLL